MCRSVLFLLMSWTLTTSRGRHRTREALKRFH
uniref:Uncharacterized protein n=1 Tax=Anguilla anguilla TaxID=7936 RepID=A0A0E9SYM9_ANGAN